VAAPDVRSADRRQRPHKRPVTERASWKTPLPLRGQILGVASGIGQLAEVRPDDSRVSRDGGDSVTGRPGRKAGRLEGVGSRGVRRLGGVDGSLRLLVEAHKCAARRLVDDGDDRCGGIG